MIVKLLTETPLELLSLKGGYRGSPESAHVKMPHSWQSHAPAQIMFAAMTLVRLGDECINAVDRSVSSLINLPYQQSIYLLMSLRKHI